MTNVIREIEGREKKHAAGVATALNNLTTTVCNLQNQQCATCKNVCDLSATISGAASVTKSLVHDGEDHDKKNDGESEDVATSYAAPILQLRGTPLAPADTTGTLDSDTLSDSVASSYAEVTPGQIGN